MASIKKFLRTIDIFGIYYNFKYQNHEKYKTVVGGIFVILLFIFVCFMMIYYFIPFVNRRNYTIVYYTMNLATTEEVDLFTADSNLAMGLECGSNNGIYDLLDLVVKYITYVKSADGTYKKYPIDLKTHKCDYDDFYYKYNEQVDYLGLKRFECMDKTNATIQGIYSDQVFSYFEFTVSAKNKSAELLDEIEKFLYRTDCKFHLAYTDIIIDLDNYETPFKQYLNDELFIQLDPNLYIKKNFYFANQYFTNDDYLIFVFSDDEEPEKKTIYSRCEEYSLWKGLNRATVQPSEYDIFSKVYIRADLKRTVIKRKYQKFHEYFADASSILIAIYNALYIIFYYFDLFYAHHILAEKIFFFKDLEDNTNFNIFKKRNDIREIISMNNLDKNNSEISQMEFDSQSKNSKINKNFPPKKSNNIKSKDLNNKEETEKERDVLKIYYNRSRPINNKLNKYSLQINEKKIEDKIEYIKITKSLKNYYNNEDNSHHRYYKENNYLENSYKRNLRRSYNSDKRINEKYEDSIDTNMEEDSSSNSNKSKKKKMKKPENSFNLFEVLITQYLWCCMCKKMKYKNQFNEKASNIIYKKMDVVTYVRNMILFDKINQIFIENEKIGIFNLISRPIISLNSKEKNEFDEFYKFYKEKDFKKFLNQIQELMHKNNKEYNDKILIEIANEYLKSLV